MSLEIVVDTETTGFDPEAGHRIVEIGCIELHNHIPTGRNLQLYLNPEREVPPEATAIHGLTNEFLAGKPVFSQVYDQFVSFIGQARLVIHNAEFDMKFINWELKNIGHAPIGWDRVIDTLALARKKFPGSPANLDALCRRFGIDNTERAFHGALLDSELLAEVYLELLGGRQHGMSLAENRAAEAVTSSLRPDAKRTYREPRAHAPLEEEMQAHQDMLTRIKNPLWKRAG